METWHSRFAYDGFRYVEVTGFPGKPEKNSLTAVFSTPMCPRPDISNAQSHLQPHLGQRPLVVSQQFEGIPTDCERHGQADKVYAINHAGVSIAREAFGDTDGYVLGDIGPLGAILEPYGDLPQETAHTIYEEQARALVEGGADAIIIETQTSLDELGLAIDAAKTAGARCISLRWCKTTSPRTGRFT